MEHARLHRPALLPCCAPAAPAGAGIHCQAETASCARCCPPHLGPCSLPGQAVPSTAAQRRGRPQRRHHPLPRRGGHLRAGHPGHAAAGGQRCAWRKPQGRLHQVPSGNRGVVRSGARGVGCRRARRSPWTRCCRWTAVSRLPFSGPGMRFTRGGEVWEPQGAPATRTPRGAACWDPGGHSLHPADRGSWEGEVRCQGVTGKVVAVRVSWAASAGRVAAQRRLPLT